MKVNHLIKIKKKLQRRKTVISSWSQISNANLAEILCNKISPISDEIKRLINEKEYLDEVLIQGASKAEEIAAKKIKEMNGSVIQN